MNKAAEAIYRNPQDIIEIGNNLKNVREEKGMSQWEVGKIMGLENTAVSRYERGLSDMRVTVLVQFLEVFGCSPEQILPNRLFETKSISEKKHRVVHLLDGMTEDDIDLVLSIVKRMNQN